MSIPVNFNGKKIIEPGVYSQIKSGVPAKPPIVTSGNLMIIDTGVGAGWGSGSGISGVNSEGVGSVYGFDNSNDFTSFMRGGVFYDLADYIFNPSNSTSDLGPGTVYFARACSTTPATITLKTIDATFIVKTKNEGLVANGVKVLENLTKGFAAIIKKSPYDATKYMVEFYQGSYAGTAESGIPYNGLSEADSKPRFIASSPEFSTDLELKNWMINDVVFNRVFEFTSSTPGTNVITADLGKLVLAIGGTEVYDSTAFDKVLETSKEIDNEFFLTDKFGDNAKSVENVKLLNLIKQGGEYQKFIVIGGGLSELEFDTNDTSSVQTAEFFDSEKVILVHSGIKRFNLYSRKEEKLSSLYHAANIAGRLGGLQPQEPLTYKKLKVNSFIHNLSDRQREKALQKGVLHNKKVSDLGQVVNQGINTLQRNTQLFNPDGTSYEISIMRIGSMLNKELVRRLRPLFIGSNSGKATPEDVKLCVQNYLRSRCVKDQQDNLIINFENVTVRLIEDYYDIQYGFYPNGPINKIFLTGFMLDYNAIAK